MLWKHYKSDHNQRRGFDGHEEVPSLRWMYSLTRAADLFPVRWTLAREKQDTRSQSTAAFSEKRRFPKVMTALH